MNTLGVCVKPKAITYSECVHEFRRSRYLGWMRKRVVRGGRALRVLGERIRELRMARNLSQEEIAERCDLHPNYVGYIERAERNVNIVVVFQIAAALGVEPADLFQGITLRDVRNLPRSR